MEPYYITRQSGNVYTVYKSPDISIDASKNRVVYMREEASGMIHSAVLSTQEMGIHQLLYFITTNPGKMSHMDSKATTLQNVQYKGKTGCPREFILDVFTNPHVAYNGSAGTQLDSFENIVSYIESDIPKEEIKECLLIDTRLATGAGISPIDVYPESVTSESFHKVQEIHGVPYELTGYIRYIPRNKHYVCNVKRNDTWWRVTDLGETYSDMVQMHTWNMNRETSFPVVLLYTRTDIRKEYIHPKPGVIRNPGNACFILSPVVLLSNVPSVTKYITGEKESRRLIQDDLTEEIISVAIQLVARSHTGASRRYTRRKRLRSRHREYGSPNRHARVISQKG